MKMLHDNLGVNEKGHLTIAGCDTVELVREHGTPLIVYDENKLRENCRVYKDAMARHFGENSLALYAGKAFCCKEMYRIAADEGVGADVVSGGELYTARAAGFPMERVFFHGNNKTDAEIAYAIDCGIGYFVADNREELDAIQEIAHKKGIKQKVILRATPGIDPHTHAKISTGKVDSKFGTAVETGQIESLTEHAVRLENIDLRGYHCHIGSQVFDIEPFCDAADIMLDFIARMTAHHEGLRVSVLNLGGGFGVRYVESDPMIDYDKNICEISKHVKSKCASLGLEMPAILMEPGRSIVADAALTLYTAGSVKTITGYKSYVSIDGGMTDNPRYALYQSAYTVLSAGRMNETPDFKCTVAGRCCESGDLIQEDVMLPSPKRGDIIAVLVTGAYNYSMASNYNRVTRPEVVSVKDGKAKVIIRRESYEYLTGLDV